MLRMPGGFEAVRMWIRESGGGSKDLPKSERPSLVFAECIEAWDSSVKIWRELQG